MTVAVKQDSENTPRGARILNHPAMFDQGMRTPVIRQDRIQVGEDDCRVTLDQTSFEVLDFSPFGIAVRSLEPIAQGLEFVDVPFFYNGVELAKLQLKRVRQEMDAEGYKVGFAITGEPLSVEHVVGIRCAREIVGSFDAYLTDRARIPDAFRQEVLEVRDLLQQIERRVNEMEERIAAEYVHAEELDAIEGAIIPMLGEQVREALDARVQRLAGMIPGLDEARVLAAYDFFRSQLGPIIYQSPFSKRSFQKPLGYAGDYEMMNMLYENQGLGRSLFARCLHYYIINMPGGKAVRNRGNYLHGKLSALIARTPADRPLRVLSVASGPAMEVQMLLPQLSPARAASIEFHLLDQDIHSLKHAQRRVREASLKHNMPVNLKLIHKNIKRVITEGLEDENYDLIYSAGLFDYFSEPVAMMATRRLFAAVKPGGQLIIGNFNVTNPSRAFMEMAWDWNLVYRTEEDLMRLGHGCGGSVEIEREPENVNLFCVIEKGVRS